MPECVLAERRLNSTRRSIDASRSAGSNPSKAFASTGASASISSASRRKSRR